MPGTPGREGEQQTDRQNCAAKKQYKAIQFNNHDLILLYLFAKIWLDIFSLPPATPAPSPECRNFAPESCLSQVYIAKQSQQSGNDQIDRNDVVKQPGCN
jgi:hypothetical protein